MGGEVTVYSGWEPEERGMSGISRKLSPGMSNPPIWGICIPLIGGMPPIMLDMSLDIIEEEDELENEEEDEEENEDLLDMELDPIELDPMLIPPIFDIILLIMSSMSPIFCICIPSPPIKLGICIPPIPMPPIIGIGPPDPDIMVEEEEEDEDDLKLEMVEPSSDWVVAAML